MPAAGEEIVRGQPVPKAQAREVRVADVTIAAEARAGTGAQQRREIVGVEVAMDVVDEVATGEGAVAVDAERVFARGAGEAAAEVPFGVEIEVGIERAPALFGRFRRTGRWASAR